MFRKVEAAGIAPAAPVYQVVLSIASVRRRKAARVFNRVQEWAAVLDLRGCQSNLRFLYSRLPHRWRIMRASAVINQVAVLFAMAVA
jgi:hypothetical protein